MTKPKLTEWFPGDVKPVHVGVYERDIYNNITYSKWDGRQWLGYCYSTDLAERERYSSDYQNTPWRGLASKP